MLVKRRRNVQRHNYKELNDGIKVSINCIRIESLFGIDFRQFPIRYYLFFDKL